MRSIMLLALAGLAGLAFSYIAEEDRCPGVTGDSCILINGAPCFNDRAMANAAGCQGGYWEAFNTYSLWRCTGNECTCFCPYVAPDRCRSVACDTKCVGSTLYSAGRCSPADGTCAYDEGHCQYGCDLGGKKCRDSAPPSAPWRQGDSMCEFVKGENCSESTDCICKSGWECDMADPDRDEIGCVPTSAFRCNDGTCDSAKGENCGSCGGNGDCQCGSKECSPQDPEADSWGCVYEQTAFRCNDDKCEAAKGENCASCGGTDSDCRCGNGKKCEPAGSRPDNWGCVYTKDACEDVECPNKCRTFTSYGKRLAGGRTGPSVTSSYSMTNGMCVNGACKYMSSTFCGKGCDDASGLCSDTEVQFLGDVTEAPACASSGEFVVVGTAQIIRKVAQPDGAVAAVGYAVSSGDKYCSGDMIITDAGSKLWVKRSSGRVTYVGPASIYKSGLYANREVVYVDGVAQEQTGMTQEEFDLLSNAKLKPIHADAMPQLAHVKLNSNVLIEADDGSERITVLEGHAEITDPANGVVLNVGEGQRYSWQAGQEVSGGEITEAGTAYDNMEDMEGGGCGPAAVMLAVLAGAAAFVTPRRR